MQPKKRSTLLIIGGLILTTLAVMGLSSHADPWITRHSGGAVPDPPGNADGIRITRSLVQDKILQGSNGHVSLALTLTAPEKPPVTDGEPTHVDLVVVLDRSGSMNGQKIHDARRAVMRLMESLSSQDRLSLVTYSNRAVQHGGLTPMTSDNRKTIRSTVERITANGGTNIGAGLKRGLAIAAAVSGQDNARRVILISDGLANQGITDPSILGTMAAAGLDKGMAVSTVGVGQAFNEHLMTALADNGGGSYYYLENPAAFAAVFQKEYQYARTAAAESVRVSMPLPAGVRLIDAGGYPIKHTGNRVVFHPGNLRYGQSRKLYLTLQVPTDAPRDIVLGGFEVHYRQGQQTHTAMLAERLTVACVNDAEDVIASIRKETWSDQVVREEFGRLKEEVAADIKAGQPDQALQRIRTYRQEKAAINAVMQAPRVTQNLESEVDALSTYVQETFAGPAPAVAAKQKQNAKALQYEGYRERRDKK